MKTTKSKTTRKTKTRATKNNQALKPVVLQEVRQQLGNMVAANAPAITEAVIEEALKGKYLPAKFLFDAVGLSVELPPGEEKPEEEDSLAKILMRQWRIGEESGEETGVLEDSELEDAAVLSGAVE
jgi:hypothetical protein